MSQVTLGASLTLREVMDLQRELLRAESDTDSLQVDGAAVERVDTAGLQLLVALARRRDAAGQTLRWTGVSPQLRHGCMRLGLESLLGLTDVPTGAPA